MNEKFEFNLHHEFSLYNELCLFKQSISPYNVTNICKYGSKRITTILTEEELD